MQKRSALLLLTLLFTSIFVIRFVVAQSAPASAGGASAIFDPVKDMFAKWQEGQLSVNVAKYLIMILLASVIYSVLDLTPFLGGAKNKEKDWLRWLIGIITAFLSIAYLNPQEIYAVLVSYNSLGFVLSAAVPFIILVFLSITTHKDGGVYGRIFARIIWFAFIIFLVFKLISAYNTVGVGDAPLISGGMLIGYLIFLGVSLLWIWFGERKFVKFLFKEELETERDILEKRLREQEIKRTSESDSLRRELNAGERASLGKR